MLRSTFQTYERILGNVYAFPNNISEEAKTFITKLLHPDPQDRGDLEKTNDSIFCHKFLKRTLQKLPTINQMAQQVRLNHQKGKWLKNGLVLDCMLMS